MEQSISNLFGIFLQGKTNPAAQIIHQMNKSSEEECRTFPPVAWDLSPEGPPYIVTNS